MENTYSTTVTSDRESTTNIIMAIVSIVLSIGICAFYAVKIFNEETINVFKFLSFLGHFVTDNPSDMVFVILINIVIIMVLVACFAFPLVTIVFAVAVLLNKAKKKSTPILMYVFLGLTISFFIRMLF